MYRYKVILYDTFYQYKVKEFFINLKQKKTERKVGSIIRDTKYNAQFNKLSDDELNLMAVDYVKICNSMWLKLKLLEETEDGADH